jgi:hypothetical protein
VLSPLLKGEAGCSLGVRSPSPLRTALRAYDGECGAVDKITKGDNATRRPPRTAHRADPFAQGRVYRTPGIRPLRETQHMTTANPHTGEIVAAGPQYDDAALRAIESFDDAMALAIQTVGDIETADNALGNGFALLDNKTALIGAPSMFLSWTFNAGDFGEFVSVHVVARNESGGARKVIVNDGSTGIFQQLREYTDRTGRQGGLFVRKGLRQSVYEYVDDKGNKRPATTFYLDTSA